jgi:ATP-dependent helicase HrpB
VSPGSPNFPADLPVVEALDELRAALSGRGRAVLVAPPGAGKTTVVPLALLDEPWLDGRRIVVLEPRRLATRAAARRMSATTGTDVGTLVGYQTRDERRIGADARIEVVTEGVLTRRLQHDPELPGVGCVIFDEVHERNLPTDLGLAFALDSASTIRPDLRLVAMSATPDVEGLTQLLDAPVVQSDGRMFDVEIRWLPRVPAKGRARQERIEPAVVSAVLSALSDEEGDVLVFLPGIGEIRRVEERLRAALGPDIDVHPLAGALPIEDQDAALTPSPSGRRRVVLATDIAETSLTVPGVRVIVDSGLAREPRFDARTGMSRLTTVSTSRSSAEQRAGRAGRIEQGAAYRLWSKIEHGSRPRHRTPEIEQADLAGFALELAAWGAGDDLAFIDTPPKAALRQARELLTDLHALDGGAITPLGRRMLGLPVHPRLARMVAVDASSLACAVATLVEERDIFRGRPDDVPVDLSLRVGALAGTGGHDLADRGAIYSLRDRARDLAGRARIEWDPGAIDPDEAGRVLMLGFPDRLAARRRPGQFRLRSGSGAWLPTDDPMAEEPFLVAADLDGRRDRARIRLAAAVDEADVLAAFTADIAEQRKLSWDADRGDLVETMDRRLGALSLGRHVGPAQPGDATTAALMARVRATKLDALTWSRSALDLRHRVGFLHRTVGEPWPDWSTRTLLATLDEWLVPYLPGATGRADLERLDVTTVLRSQLPWPQGSDLHILAPGVLELPTGREVPIEYGTDQPQVSVRVQDLFGLDAHPMAGGHPIRLHLLSPADRPIQVTADLPGFWRGSWKEVRKEMAGRYPKHQWPKDPAHAEPKRLKGNSGKRDPRQGDR